MPRTVPASVIWVESSARAIPKSAILTVPSGARSRFLGFTSRWTSPAACAWARPAHPAGRCRRRRRAGSDPGGKAPRRASARPRARARGTVARPRPPRRRCARRWVRQPGGKPRLAHEPAARVHLGRERFAYELDRHRSVEGRIVSQMNGGHATVAQDPLEPVAPVAEKELGRRQSSPSPPCRLSLPFFALSSSSSSPPPPPRLRRLRPRPRPPRLLRRRPRPRPRPRRLLPPGPRSPWPAVVPEAASGPARSRSGRGARAGSRAAHHAAPRLCARLRSPARSPARAPSAVAAPCSRLRGRPRPRWPRSEPRGAPRAARRASARTPARRRCRPPPRRPGPEAHRSRAGCAHQLCSTWTAIGNLRRGRLPCWSLVGRISRALVYRARSSRRHGLAGQPIPGERRSCGRS